MSTAAQHPHLTVVPDPPATPLVEGVVVEKIAAVEKAVRPSWLQARAAAVAGHAWDHRLYLPWAARGYRRIGAHWWDRYQDDYPQMIAAAREALRTADVDKQNDLKTLVKERRSEYLRHRLAHLGTTGAWTLAGGTGLAVGTVTGGLMVDLAVALGAYLVGLRHGAGDAPQSTIHAPRPINGITDAEVTERLTAPFPVRQAASLESLRDCVLAALKKGGVPVEEVFDVTRHFWGWQCTVRVGEGTPEAIIKAAGDLETTFDLGANCLRVQPLKERRACAILRLVESSPFAGAPGMPYRAPKSISIGDQSRAGTSVGGEPLPITLAGVMGLWVAASGGGKTGILQALAEITTACADNVTIDLDPFGDGLEDLHDAVRVTARSHEQIEAVLLFLLVLAKARAKLRKKLGMGKTWETSPERPGFTAFFDEFPKGSELAKQLAFQLLLVGRKEAITLQIASQGGTKLYLGENIAQMIALKGVGPCKVTDTRAVFGDGSVAEGWLPHNLSPATKTDPKDAGHVYLQGLPGKQDEPIEYAFHETRPEVMRELAAERKAAGLVEPDQDSLNALFEVDLPEIDGLPDLLSWPALLKLCDAQPPAGGAVMAPIVAEALAVMDERGADRMRTETLAAAMHLTAAELKAKMRAAGVPDPSGIGEIDGLQNPRGYKRETLASA